MIKIFAKGVNYLLGGMLRNKKVFVGSSLDYLHRHRNIDRNYFDYIRLSTLELVSSEITKKNLGNLQGPIKPVPPCFRFLIKNPPFGGTLRKTLIMCSVTDTLWINFTVSFRTTHRSQLIWRETKLKTLYKSII